MLKPTKNIWRSNRYLTLLANDKGTDQTSLCLCCSQSRKVRVSRVFVHMMLKPRLPGLRLATRLPVRKKKHLFILVIQVIEIRTESCKTALLPNIYT